LQYFYTVAAIPVMGSPRVFQQQCSHTRYEIAEAYGGHGYEAEIEAIEEIPVVLPQHEHAGAASKVQKEQCNGG